MMISKLLRYVMMMEALDNGWFIVSCFRSQVLEMQVVPGQGITGIVSGQFIGCGNRTLMSSIAPGSALPLVSPEDRGSICYVARDSQVIGAISVSDVVRKEAATAIERLTDLGVQSAMLTGMIAYFEHFACEYNSM